MGGDGGRDLRAALLAGAGGDVQVRRTELGRQNARPLEQRLVRARPRPVVERHQVLELDQHAALRIYQSIDSGISKYFYLVLRASTLSIGTNIDLLGLLNRHFLNFFDHFFAIFYQF